MWLLNCPRESSWMPSHWGLDTTHEKFDLLALLIQPKEFAECSFSPAVGSRSARPHRRFCWLRAFACEASKISLAICHVLYLWYFEHFTRMLASFEGSLKNHGYSWNPLCTLTGEKDSFISIQRPQIYSSGSSFRGWNFWAVSRVHDKKSQLGLQKSIWHAD